MATKRIDDKSFVEITGHQLSNSTFLNMFNILQDDNDEYYLNIFRSYSIYEDTLNDVVYFGSYEVDNEDWWEAISYKHYNTVHYWWIHCIANNVVNPFEELEAGDNLKILNGNMLPQLIREIKRISEQ
jgi:hypothetical protein